MDERQRFRWFLGIDVSKETFDGCCIPSHGERLFNLSASMDRKGFEEADQATLYPIYTQESVLVGMESTACYHIQSFILSLSL